MKDKVIKYLIFLLILPIVISLVIACTSNTNNTDPYNHYENDNIADVKLEQIDTSPYIYFGVFVLVIGASGIWLYIKKKEGF